MKIILTVTQKNQVGALVDQLLKGIKEDIVIDEIGRIEEEMEKKGEYDYDELYALESKLEHKLLDHAIDMLYDFQREMTSS